MNHDHLACAHKWVPRPLKQTYSIVVTEKNGEVIMHYLQVKKSVPLYFSGTSWAVVLY